MIEICCGSYEDALAAYKGGAKQIELNSALSLGGLTPSLATLQLVKENTDLKVICMIRPRGGGFCYSSADFDVMLKDCQLFLDYGADGIAFGFLNADKSIDLKRTKQFVNLIHLKNKEAIFHRAIDVCINYEESIEQLIHLGVNRILTSGQKNKATDAIEILTHIQKKFGNQIEFLIGSGINPKNVKHLINSTHIYNIHSSCKEWKIDDTTSHNDVNYSIPFAESINAYDIVSSNKVRELIQAVHSSTCL